MNEPQEFADLKQVKLMCPGVHKGQEITSEMLDAMARNTPECLEYLKQSEEAGLYAENEQIDLKGKPIPGFINLNHQEDLPDTIKKVAKDIGVKLYTKMLNGVKWLCGDFSNVPNDLAKFIKQKYPMRSIELMPPLYNPIKKRVFPYVIRSVGFLSREMPPAVSGQQNDFVVVYNADLSRTIETFVLDVETEVINQPTMEGIEPMADKETKQTAKNPVVSPQTEDNRIEEFQAQLEKQQHVIEEFQAQLEKEREEKEILTKIINKDREEREEEKKIRSQKDIQDFCNRLITYHNVQPAVLNEDFQAQLMNLNATEIIEFSEDYQRSQRDYWMDWISKWLTNDPKIPAGEFGAQEGKKDEQTLINEYLKETEKLPEDERRAKIIATYLND
jgi:hypothetical protein